MQRVLNTIKFAALVGATAALMTTAGEAAWSKKVKNACGMDYQDFCSQYAPDSTQARRCFESNRKSLSKECVRALVDAGEVPAKYLKK